MNFVNRSRSVEFGSDNNSNISCEKAIHRAIASHKNAFNTEASKGDRKILTACDSHRVRLVEDGERIEKGIYVSRPRRHLVVNSKTIGVSELNAPKRELWIPFINELFASTAKFQGDQSIGVILSGTMHDGVLSHSDSNVTLAIGADGWPFPIPLTMRRDGLRRIGGGVLLALYAAFVALIIFWH